MSVYLESLVPKSILAAWFPLDNDGDGGTGITDESGNELNLTQAGIIPVPIIETQSTISNRPAVVFDETADKVLGSAPVVLEPQDIFVIGKVDHDTTFGADYRGLLSGLASANSTAVLVGNPSTTKWFDSAIPLEYYKSGVFYTAENRQAPFDYFEQMRIKSPNVALDGLQFGNDREFADRLFAGKFADAMFFTEVLTEQQVKGLKLYGDLKFGLYLLNGQDLYFPSPDITGIHWEKCEPRPDDWKSVTITHEYDDDGESFNETTESPRKYWEVNFKGHSALENEIFVAFYNRVRYSKTFSFTDRAGVTHENVRIAEYNNTYQGHRSWINECRFLLKKNPQ